MKQKVVIRVRMEPELEGIAGHLGPAERVEMAAKLDRWVHQLRVTSSILLARQQPLRRRRLRALDSVRLGRN